MRAKITYMWGDRETYYASSRDDCRHDTDKSAWIALESSGEMSIQMGLVYIDRIHTPARAPNVPRETKR